MSPPAFVLDPRLIADTHRVTSLPLCEVLLMNDARYAWLILVPRRAKMSEIDELCAADQTQLWQEVNRAAAALRLTAPYDKLNLGALGNIVHQLHIHVIARHQGDAAWPGPVWGHSQAQAYAEPHVNARLAALKAVMAN
ncbi:MAG: HIT domain-containing protein [Rhodanobacter sp.]